MVTSYIKERNYEITQMLLLNKIKELPKDEMIRL